MAGPIAAVNPAVLIWARERAGLTIDQVADALGKRPEMVGAWEAGTASPTYVQLEKLAYAVYRRPLALFFFPEPPTEADPEQSFRTLPDFEIEELSSDTRFKIRQAKAMQLSLAELTGGKNPSSRFILRNVDVTASQRASTTASSVRRYFGIDIDQQRQWRSNDEALKVWRAAVEEGGVFVFKDSFKQKDVSGFSLYDEEFPLIYINNSTAKTRQMFTLFHELAHLLLHTSGVTKRDDTYIGVLHGDARRVEIFCNQFAAEVLIPSSDFKLQDVSIDDANLARLARRYKVSREVVLRRLLDLELVDSAYYKKKAKQWADDYFERSESEGGNYYATLATYLSDSFVHLAFRNYYDGTISLDDLARHLNVNPTSLGGLEQAVLQKGVG